MLDRPPRTAKQPELHPLGLIVALTVSATLASPALIAGSGRASVDEVLRQRAERPAEPGAGRRAPAGGVAGVRLFFRTGTDNGRVVRSTADVNGDGREEVLLGIEDSGTDNILALDGASIGAATDLWGFEPMDGVSGGSPWGDLGFAPASDVDGNGFPNLLAGTAYGGRTAYNLDTVAGAVQWKFDTYLASDSGWIYSLVEMSDVTGDGMPEAAFGVGSDNDSVYLVNGAANGGMQATVVWQYPASDAVFSVANLGDVDGDGDDDVLAAVGDLGSEAVCLSGGSASPAGTELWDYAAGDTVYAALSIPDFSGDGLAEALIAVWAVDGSSARALNGATGAELWRSTTVTGPGMLLDLLEDVTGDGVPEVVVSSWDNAAQVLNGATGAQVWKTFVGVTNGGDVWTSRAIGDISGDGIEDVIAGSFDTNIYAFDGTDGTELWSYFTDNRIFSVHPVGDLNGDGRPEVVAATQDTNNNEILHVLDGAPNLSLFADGFESGDTTAWSSTVSP